MQESKQEIAKDVPCTNGRKSVSWVYSVPLHMMTHARKGLCNLRTTRPRSACLRISAGWSGPSLSAFGFNGYYSMNRNAQIRQHGCTCWSGPTLSAQRTCIRAFSVRKLSDYLGYTAISLFLTKVLYKFDETGRWAKIINTFNMKIGLA